MTQPTPHCQRASSVGSGLLTSGFVWRYCGWRDLPPFLGPQQRSWYSGWAGQGNRRRRQHSAASRPEQRGRPWPQNRQTRGFLFHPNPQPMSASCCLSLHSLWSSCYYFQVLLGAREEESPTPPWISLKDLSPWPQSTEGLYSVWAG